MNILHDYNIIRKHVIAKAHSQWRNNKLNTETKDKASQILQPVIENVIQENTFTEQTKEKIKNNALKQEEIYTSYNEKLKD